jgi:hypothetical protein
MTDQINQILNDREQTHGSFQANAETAQTLKVVLRNNERFYALPPTQREALDMIMHKASRAINGSHNHKDTWDDIAGYATLVSKELTPTESTSPGVDDAA